MHRYVPCFRPRSRDPWQVLWSRAPEKAEGWAFQRRNSGWDFLSKTRAAGFGTPSLFRSLASRGSSWFWDHFLFRSGAGCPRIRPPIRGSDLLHAGHLRNGRPAVPAEPHRHPGARGLLLRGIRARSGRNQSARQKRATRGLVPSFNTGKRWCPAIRFLRILIVFSWSSGWVSTEPNQQFSV